MPTDKPRCHWCDGKIDNERGYIEIKSVPPVESGGLPLGRDDSVFACWFCGIREVENRVMW